MKLSPAYPPNIRGEVIVGLASVWTITVGGLALIGWQFDLPVLTTVRPGSSPTFPLAACAFLGLGLGLWIIGTSLEHARARVGQAIGLAVATLGAVTLAEYLLGWDAGIDTLLFPDAVRAVDIRFPGRVPPHSAIVFVTAGLALAAFAARSARVQRAADLLCHASIGLALAGLLGYAYNAAYIRSGSEYSGIALLGAISTVVVTTGALFIRPQTSFVAPFLSPGPGGILARHLGPVLLVLPIVVGVLISVGGRTATVDANLATTIAIVASLMVVIYVIGRTARTLDRTDADQQSHAWQMQRDRDLMTALWESMRDAIAVLDVDGRVLDVTRSWCQLMGTERASAIGTRPPYPWLAEGPDLDDMIQTALGDIGAPFDVAEHDLHVQRADGTRVPVLSGVVPVVGADNQPHKFMLSYRDMTHREQDQERLRQRSEELQEAMHAKDNFFASMSHELRTPLNSILGFTGTLLMRLPGDLNADQEQQLQIVERSARHLLSLINDVLDIAKIESNADIQVEPLRVAAIVDEVAQSLAPLATDKGLDLDVEVPDGSVMAMADQRGLMQILSNLVSNAVNFTDTGNVTISLRSAPDQETVAIAVSDTGPGIPPEDLTRIFNRFEQAATITPRSYGRTGLGLTIARHLAQKMDVDLTVASTVGEGTTFTVKLKEARNASQYSYSR